MIWQFHEDVGKRLQVDGANTPNYGSSGNFRETGVRRLTELMSLIAYCHRSR